MSDRVSSGVQRQGAASVCERIDEKFRVHWLLDNIHAATKSYRDAQSSDDTDEAWVRYDERGFALGFVGHRDVQNSLSGVKFLSNHLRLTVLYHHSEPAPHDATVAAAAAAGRKKGAGASSDSRSRHTPCATSSRPEPSGSSPRLMSSRIRCVDSRHRDHARRVACWAWSDASGAVDHGSLSIFFFIFFIFIFCSFLCVCVSVVLLCVGPVMGSIGPADPIRILTLAVIESIDAPTRIRSSG